MKLKNQMDGGERFRQLPTSPTADETFEYAVRTPPPPFLPTSLTQNYFGFGIVGMMQRQDANTTLIKVHTSVNLHPIFLLHTAVFCLLPVNSLLSSVKCS
jgi:hypothetical protein